MQPEEFEIWNKVLGGAIPKALDFAFENWQRNGSFFPKPKDIVNLIECYIAGQQLTTQKCDSICKARHGKGYDTNDALWLWKRMQQELAKGEAIDSDALLNELDSKREGGAPVWRRKIA